MLLLLLLLLLLIKELPNALQEPDGLGIPTIRATITLDDHLRVTVILRLILLISHLILNRLNFHVFLILTILLLSLLWTLLILLIVVRRR